MSIMFNEKKGIQGLDLYFGGNPYGGGGGGNPYGGGGGGVNPYASGGGSSSSSGSSARAEARQGT